MTPRLSELPLVEPASVDEWRTWLEANHESSAGIWLAVGKKGGKRTTLTYEQAVEEAVRFNWIDSTVHPIDGHRFRQLYTPRKRGSEWSRSNKERVERLASRGLLMPVALEAIEAAKKDGSWNQLDDVENLVMPADLTKALAKNPKAKRNFESFSASQRKLVLYWVASAKRPETRARRIAETVDAAAEGRPPRPITGGAKT